MTDQQQGVIVLMEWEKKLLLLQRARCPISPGSWGAPGGKVESGETLLAALIREIEEELQIRVHPDHLEYVRSFDVHHPQARYQLHFFRWSLSSPPAIILDPSEHTDYVWQPIADLAQLPIINGGFDIFRQIYSKKSLAQ